MVEQHCEKRKLSTREYGKGEKGVVGKLTFIREK